MVAFLGAVVASCAGSGTGVAVLVSVTPGPERSEPKEPPKVQDDDGTKHPIAYDVIDEASAERIFSDCRGYKSGTRGVRSPKSPEVTLAPPVPHSRWALIGVSEDDRCLAIEVSYGSCETLGPMKIVETATSVTLTNFVRAWRPGTEPLKCTAMLQEGDFGVPLRAPLGMRTLRDGCAITVPRQVSEPRIA